jgi:hypothetical protein
MIARIMRKKNIVDRIINRISDGKTLATLFLYSCLVGACIVCYVMLQSVYGTYIWWTATTAGQVAAAVNPEELYRNCWWGMLTIVNNLVSLSLFLRISSMRLKQLNVMAYSVYPTIPYTGFLTGTFASLYFVSAIWSLVGNNLQLLLNRQLVTISGSWQVLFPYHKILGFNDGQGNFVFSWNAFWSFNFEMILYFLVLTILLHVISQFILSYYTFVVETKISLAEEGNKKNNVNNSNGKKMFYG